MVVSFCLTCLFALVFACTGFHLVERFARSGTHLVFAGARDVSGQNSLSPLPPSVHTTWGHCFAVLVCAPQAPLLITSPLRAGGPPPHFRTGLLPACTECAADLEHPMCCVAHVSKNPWYSSEHSPLARLSQELPGRIVPICVDVTDDESLQVRSPLQQQPLAMLVVCLLSDRGGGDGAHTHTHRQRWLPCGSTQMRLKSWSTMLV